MDGWALVLGLLASTATAAPSDALDLSLPPAAVRQAVPIAQPARASLSGSIEAARSVSLFDLGIKASREAVLECQRGDYPGGGLGALSMPSGHVAAQADHCRQF